MTDSSDPPVRRSSVGKVLRQLVPWLAPHHRLLAGAAVCTLAITALFQAGPLLIRHAVDVDIPSQDPRRLYSTVVAFVLAQAASLCLTYLQRMLLETAGQGALQALKERLFEHTLSLSLSYFDRTPVGRLMSRLESDAESLRQLLSFTGVILIGDSLSVLVSLGVMLSIQPSLCLVTTAILVGLVGLSLAFNRIGTPIFRRIRERAAEVSAFLQERLSAVAVLQAYRQEAASGAAMDQVNRRRFRAVWSGNLLWNSYFNLLFLAEAGSIAATLAYGGHLLANNQVTVGVLLMFVEYLRRFFIPIYRLSEQLNTVQRAFVAGERVFDMLAEPATLEDPQRPEPWSGLTESIEFDHVSFSYRPGEPVLQDISFRLPKGQRWAVVGATGSGKSTLIGLLLRFHDPEQGSVRVDGIDLRNLRQRDLRRPMALVLQDVVLFPGSIEDNLTLGDPDLTSARVRDAAVATQAAPFIEALPGGYDTVLSERGANLSAGQRQLLSFARALARHPNLLILDEATAAVDPQTERAIQTALDKLLEGRTALMVAHRLATVRHADHILVMDGGRLVEQGTHESLLATDGIYRRLYRLQTALDEVAA